MSGTMQISPLTKPSLDSSRLQLFQSKLGLSTNPSILKLGFEYSNKFCVIKGENIKALTNCTQGSVQNGLESSLVKLELIASETQFDRVIADAQQLDEAVVILWYVLFSPYKFWVFIFFIVLEFKVASFFG